MKPKQIQHKNIACTIVAQNYLGRADVLARSFKKFHPEIPFFILVVDDFTGKNKKNWKSVSAPIFVLTDLEKHFGEKSKSFLRGMLFPYDVMEASTSVKPFYLSFLFERFAVEKLLFLDPDTMLTGALDDVFEKLDQHTVVLTPHLVSFSNLEKNLVTEKQISLSGVFNLGFLALRKSEENDKFLAWWAKRLHRHCQRKAHEGIFTDQKWIDLAFGAMENVFVLRDKGINVAHWNLHERALWQNKKGQFFVDDKPLRLFHFSGFDETQVEKLTKHAKIKISPNSPLAKLIGLYLKELKISQNQNFLKVSFYLNYFSNGVKIPSVVKSGWSQYNKMPIFDDPFDTKAKNSFFKWLFVDSHGELNNFLMIIYFMRSDLQKAFDLKLASSCGDYLQWYLNYGHKDFELDPRFSDLMQLSLGKRKDRDKSLLI